MTTVCVDDMCCHSRMRVKNVEWPMAIWELTAKARRNVPLACKQAYYKNLKLEPIGVKCLQSWNSKATAVSVVGALAGLADSLDEHLGRMRNPLVHWGQWPASVLLAEPFFPKKYMLQIQFIHSVL